MSVIGGVSFWTPTHPLNVVGHLTWLFGMIVMVAILLAIICGFFWVIGSLWERLEKSGQRPQRQAPAPSPSRDEYIAENARLGVENARLRVENERLSKEYGDLQRESLRRRVEAGKAKRQAYELGREEGRLRAEGLLPEDPS